ncbi:SMC-Scp complex subunit ScpB [Patulibacter brassicae]|uniref:SMC-Scp complex subunit ScpB n=1 Tax=Patulibacter brassicae TaxID=1705717 RepID=A0ABU4VQG1_9ACTN|nr:SMC-Scp complex subunit ScpB [Patulibacter brassicae]MDX8153705.1 SMC-Scp complex subunit ScpB [Patulibacter brassicae]
MSTEQEQDRAGEPPEPATDAVDPSPAPSAPNADSDADEPSVAVPLPGEPPARDFPAPPPGEQSGLASQIEALLFLSSEPVTVDDLAAACDVWADELAAALEELRRAYAPGRRGLLLREIGGGFLLSTAPETEPAARRLLTAPRTPPLTPAQAETLAIVAYLQPVSRPEITRIRGVAADSACATLVERGMIEEAGRSQFGAVLYRTTGLFLKLFGLDGVADLPDPAAWDPTPEETADLRDRLLRAGDARGGREATDGDDPAERPPFDPDALVETPADAPAPAEDGSTAPADAPPAPPETASDDGSAAPDDEPAVLPETPAEDGDAGPDAGPAES